MVRRTPLIAVLVCVTAACPAALGQARGRGNGSLASRHGWLFNLAAGTREAARTGKPLMVVFRCEP
jgi:hypothetical protein